MDALVYKTYMRDEIIPKTVIFASSFGLTIDSFKTADEHGKYPYRIRFYHGNNIVGHMDLEVSERFGELYPGWEYPFILFTPVGNVSGHYLSSSNNNLFSYFTGRILDVYHILSFLLDDLNLPSFKLENIWKCLVENGIVADIKGNNHSAITDITQTYMLYKKIVKPAKEAYLASL